MSRSPAIGCGAQRRRGSTVLVALLAGLIASCSDATSPGTPVETTVVPSSDDVTFSALGQFEVLGVTVLDQNGSPMGGAAVAWSSSADSVATVNVAGLVTAVGNGTATITASSGGVSAQVSVTVAQAAASLVVTPDSVVLRDPGDSGQLSVVVLDEGGSSVVGAEIAWSSSDATIARVDDQGVVTAVATGTVTISAEADGAVGLASARVEPEVTLVAAGPTTLAGAVTTQLSLAVRVEDLLGSGYAGRTVTWSAGPGSGTIASGATGESGATGHVGAVWELGTTAGPQQATASIESRGSPIVVTFDATVEAGPAASASLVADTIHLSGQGETAFLGPTFTDAFGNPTAPTGIVWETRDAGVAAVSSEGLVTATNEGTTYVVASLGSPTDSLQVIVTLRGAITVTFDDGWLEAYDNAYPVFQEFGLRGNIAVNPAQVGYPAYMTKPHLDEVHAAGWSIVSHAMTHDTLTTQSAGELDWELRASQEWIEAQGYNGANVFVVPFHIWGARERDAIGQYYEATRGTPSNMVSPDSLVSWRPSNPYDLTGIEAKDLPFTDASGRDKLRALLQRAVDEGAFIDVFFHHLTPDQVPAFRETLAVIDEFSDRVLPYHELYPTFARSVF